MQTEEKSPTGGCRGRRPLPWERRANGGCFVIAEIGQNHQGNLDTAKNLILAAKDAGVDCVKFQKTCISEKFNNGALNRTYDSPNSWGTTYRDHKEFLEFNDSEFSELQRYAADIGIMFTASAMDEVSLQKLCEMSVPFIKIGSGDSNNIKMIEHAASKNIPLMISTGMIGKKDVENIYDLVKKYHTDFCLLHCVSAYPTPYEECNLNVLKDYQNSFPDISIGYSGHELGVSVSLAAVTLGAKILERHVTLDKNQKGSDHICSLLPGEMKYLIRQIRIIEKALGVTIKTVVPSENLCIDKLRKSLVTSIPMKRGHVINENDITVKVSDPKGIDAKFYKNTIGRIIGNDKLQDEPIFETDFIV